MSRPPTRTAYLHPLYSTAIQNLFGGITHAWQTLEVAPEGVDYQTFRRAVNGDPCTPEQIATIETCWRQWTEKYLAQPDRLTFMRCAE